MSSRIDLHKLLVKTLGSSNVYFQPPETLKLKYPAIIYALDRIDNKYADDIPYTTRRAYSVTIIDKNPDSEIVDRIAALPSCKFNRFFVSDNLNHTVFTITY